jgi:hypothetical protein
MSVLKEPLATPSRVRGIYRYLLQIKGQREKRQVLEQILSPNKLVEHLLSAEDKLNGKKAPHIMFRRTLNESIKCGLLIDNNDEICINTNLPEEARNPQLGDNLLPNTLATLFFASGNTDEEDFGYVCTWFLAQDIYDFSGNWKVVEEMVVNQGVAESLELKMSNNTLSGQMDDWICYIGLAWGHALDGKKVTVPDPTLYIKRNLKDLFQKQVGTKLLIREFIDRLAKKCPLFETGKFREMVETHIGRRQPNYLSTSTAFALFRLQDEGYIQLKGESDADIMILPKVNNQFDHNGRISHIIWQGEKS